MPHGVNIQCGIKIKGEKYMIKVMDRWDTQSHK